MIPVFRTTLLALSLLSAGCANLGTAPQVPADAGTIRNYQQSIDIAGRMSVRYQQYGRDEALHGSFEWQQRPGRTQLTLSSPLGQTIAQIAILPNGATLTQSGQPPLAAADADALTAQALGWPLPVSGLREWLQGNVTERSGKKLVATPQDENTDIVTADGWRIRYAAWDATAAPRPRRIDLSRTTEQAGEVALRLVIDTYEPR
nr:lipoprotein insertase outer membrane protein LolB [uncultured Noviherbaspirillum sp.]